MSYLNKHHFKRLFMAIASYGYDLYYGFVVGVGMQLMKSFSLYETVPKMMDSSPKPNQLQGLDGIRFLSMSWVILGHVYAFPMYYGVRKFH